MTKPQTMLSRIMMFACLSLLLQTCDAPAIEELETYTQPTVQAAIPCPTPLPECKGHIPYPVCNTVFSQGHAGNQAFDIIVQVDSTPWPCMPPGCVCREVLYCVTLSFPPQVVDNAAKAGVHGPIENYTSLESNGLGGYVGQENPVTVARREAGMIDPTEPYVHEICVGPGEQVMFSLDSLFLANYDMSTAVIKSGGLCIVTDIHNPGEPGDFPELACDQ